MRNAIIFDLGGVLLNLDYQKTEDAFVQLGLTNFALEYSQLQQTDLFDQFECGKISSFHFINRILDLLPPGTNANQVVHAWNAMILDFPTDRLKKLENLAKKNRLFLLSNTNDLHLDAVKRALKKAVGHENLAQYFEKVYYSCELNMRKPHVETFQYVLNDNNLDQAHTIFIDDSPQHIEGAKLAGIDTILLQKNQEVMDLPFLLAQLDQNAI